MPLGPDVMPRLQVRAIFLPSLCASHPASVQTFLSPRRLLRTVLHRLFLTLLGVYSSSSLDCALRFRSSGRPHPPPPPRMARGPGELTRLTQLAALAIPAAARMPNSRKRSLKRAPAPPVFGAGRPTSRRWCAPTPRQ